MSTRTTRNVVTFTRPFFLASIGRELPAGQYEVVTDEELIEGLSFPAYRRIGSMMVVPAEDSRSVEMQSVDPQQLEAALDADTLDEPAGQAPGPVQTAR